MGRFSKAAKRYVKAYFETALEEGRQEDAARDMELIRQTIAGNADLAEFLKQPVVSTARKFAVVQKIFKNRVSDLTNRLLTLLAKRNRLDILEDITLLFEEFYKKFKGTVEAVLVTATPVDDALKNEFLQKVKEITGKSDVVLENKIDPDIIGGYILRIGDLKIDDSVKGKLQNIKTKLSV
jgi:F-type H+-transporting ATPase subunit delta